MKRSQILTLISLPLVVIRPDAVARGQCIAQTGVGYVLESVEYSDAVLLGTVVGLADFAVTYAGETVPTRITAKVLKRWKGPEVDTLVVHQTVDIVHSEPYPFELDSTYLIFAKYYPWRPEQLQTNDCLPNRLYHRSLGMMALLGPPRWPQHCLERQVEGQRICERR